MQIFEDNINLLQKPIENDKDHQLEEPPSKSRSCQGYYISLTYSFPRALKEWLKGTLRLKLIHAISSILALPSTKVNQTLRNSSSIYRKIDKWLAQSGYN